MRRITALFLSLVLILGMAGCTSTYMDERLVSLEEQVKQLQTEKETLTLSQSELEVANELLENANEDYEISQNELLSSKSTLEARITELEAELETTTTERETALQNELTALQDELDEVDAKLEGSFDGAFILKLGNDLEVVNFKTSSELSLFEVIETLDITLEYDDTSFGHMITAIGTLEVDLFKWISLYKNGESSMVGVDDITYINGDIIEFKELTVTWESTFNAVYNGDGGFDNSSFTALTGETFYISNADLPEGFTTTDLIEGSEYVITGLSEVGSKGYGCSNCVIPSNIEMTYVDDFTELYDLEAGSEVFLKFTVTELSAGWIWGNEVKASDANGLLSKDITGNLLNPYSSGYLFYTFPESINLVIGETYVAKLAFDLFPPNSKAQLGFAGTDIDGNVDLDTVEIYLLDSNGDIVESAVTTPDTPEIPVVPEGVKSFHYFRDEMNTGDQCQVEFTVTSISWGTPQATDSFGNPSTDVIAYLFDMTWSGAELDKTYIATVEKLANGQISLVGELVEVINE